MDKCRRKNLFGRFIALTAGAVIPTVFMGFIDPDPRAVWIFFVHSAAYSYIIGSLAYFLVQYSWPQYLRLKAPWNWMFRLGVLLSCGIGGTLLACLFLLAIGWITPATFWGTYAIDVRIATLVTLLIGAAISTYESMRAQLEQTTLELRTKELERERALKLATEARLNSLESCIHPHFLFNTLNSISALIEEDPKAAERLIERMAALLRFSLDANQHGLVPLENEMSIVTDYLEIERARFGGRLRYRVDIGPHLGHASVPPLSIQTLVENSVKYAIAPSRSGGDIHIRGERPNGSLRVVVSDSGPGFDPDTAPPGHGIDNLRGRLAALFGDSARLSVEGSSVSLLIPQNGNSK